MTAIAMPTTGTPTSNGNVTFLDNALAAAQQAGLDVANFSANGSGNGDVAVTSAALGVAATIAGAVFSAGQLAVNVANAANDETTGQLQIDVINYSSVPVVVYNYKPNSANVTDVPTPLAPGDNDVFLITQDEEFDSNSTLGIDLLIGSGTNSIQTQFGYGYADIGKPGRWTVGTTVDGTQHDYPTQLQMFGLTFAGNGDYPSFSVYTSTIETASGVLSLSVYDYKPAPAS